LKEKINRLVRSKKQEIRKNLKDIKNFIKKKQYKKKERPIDPKKLPHRTVPVKEIELIDRKELKKDSGYREKDARYRIQDTGYKR
jgi:hypothetical protein